MQLNYLKCHDKANYIRSLYESCQQMRDDFPMGWAGKREMIFPTDQAKKEKKK